MKRRNDKIQSGEGFVLITPEYNHRVPAVLKNAIGSVYVSFGFGCGSFTTRSTGAIPFT